MSVESKLSVAAVVVTFNRLSLLKECISSLRNQSRKIDNLIVVNNGSDDGTTEWLSEQSDLIVINQENLGSSGGQYSGIKHAVSLGSDWIWCMDDDSFCSSSALLNLISFITQYKNVNELGFLYPKVLWQNKSLHSMNLPGIFHQNNKWQYIGAKNMRLENCRIDVASFVGILFKRTAVEEIGLPVEDLFIWYDDLEYTSRFGAKKNYYISNSVLNHITVTRESVDLFTIKDVITLKQAYGIRNFSYFYWEKNKLYFLSSIFKGMLKILLRNKRNRIKNFYKTLCLIRKGIKSDLSKIEFIR